MYGLIYEFRFTADHNDRAVQEGQGSEHRDGGIYCQWEGCMFAFFCAVLRFVRRGLAMYQSPKL
jgi:hypothetical protein